MGNKQLSVEEREYAPKKIDHSTKSELREPGPTPKDFEDTLRNYGSPFIENGDQNAEVDIVDNATTVSASNKGVM